MREFKFRAWDKYKLSMVHDTKWAIRFSPKENICSGVMLEEDGAGAEECRGEWNDCDSIIVMQYTGLKDKNGVEIFEGDIIEYPISQFPSYKDKIMFKDVVKWEEDQVNCGFKILYFHKCEVIGNIHQHPELLEKSK